MSYRVITPYSGFPDRDFLTALESGHQCMRNMDNITATGIFKGKLRNKFKQRGTLQSYFSSCFILLLNISVFTRATCSIAQYLLWHRGWLGGWLSHASIVSKRLNLS